jgi:hypothetical protein
VVSLDGEWATGNGAIRPWWRGRSLPAAIAPRSPPRWPSCTFAKAIGAARALDDRWSLGQVLGWQAFAAIVAGIAHVWNTSIPPVDRAEFAYSNTFQALLGFHGRTSSLRMNSL